MNPKELTAFLENDVLRVVKYELNIASERYHSDDCPNAILLAGQPGAGKTVLSDMFALQYDDDIAFVNGDDYRRQHPHYRELYQAYGSDFVSMISPFSNEVANRLIDAYSDMRFNLIIEGTGRTVEVPKSTAEKLTAKGYAVEMAVIAARPVVSLISTLLRFYDMNKGGTIPRSTAVEAHDNVVKALPANLDTLVNVPEIQRLMIWDREQNCVYDSSSDERLPSKALTGYWNAEWSKAEINAASKDISRLEAMEEQYCLGQTSVIDELRRRFAQETER